MYSRQYKTFKPYFKCFNFDILRMNAVPRPIPEKKCFIEPWEIVSVYRNINAVLTLGMFESNWCLCATYVTNYQSGKQFPILHVLLQSPDRFSLTVFM